VSQLSFFVFSVLVLVLVLQVWCRVVKHYLVTLIVIMMLKDTATFQALFIVSFFCAWKLEPHYCGAQQWRSLTEKLNPPSAFVYLRWFWSWSCYFGLGLGLKNLVLFTWSLVSRPRSTVIRACRCLWATKLSFDGNTSICANEIGSDGH